MKIVLLTNYIAHYRLPLYECLYRRYEGFRVLISTKMDVDRDWAIKWGDLVVEEQNSISYSYSWKHPKGFNENVRVYIPYDTIHKLLKISPDVIISSEMGFRSLQAMIYKALKPHTKLIIWATVSEQTEKGRGIVREYFRKLLLLNTDAILVNGRSGANYISKFKIARERIFTVPYTTDFSIFPQKTIYKEHDEICKLLYIGKVDERKGLTLFIKCLIDWSQKNPERLINFLIIGDGHLTQAIENTPVPNNLGILCRPAVPNFQLAETYQGADVFVFPSLADEWGVVVSEAMASGLPVLGSIFSQAVEELVIDGFNGWTFRSDDYSETMQALSIALNNPISTLFEMGRNSRKIIEQQTPGFAAEQINYAIEFTVKGSI